MSWSLCLQHVDEKYYIHKLFNPLEVSGSKTTNNMNYAMLFSSEAQAIHYRQRAKLPDEFDAKFIPIQYQAFVIPDKESNSNGVSQYKKLRVSNVSLEDSLPDFFKEI